MKRLLFYCLGLMTLLGCEPEDQSPFEPDYLVFGHFYGFCGGEQCVEIFKIQGGQLYEDTKDQYPNRNGPYDGNFVRKSEVLYEKVRDLPFNFPPRLLLENDTIIGMPDAADGGGIYLEISKDGQRRYYFIDKTRYQVPDYLHPYLDQVEAAINELK
ncbi:hypothetical protein [Rufibacter roseolus]|uniref:hypothetical protein n=1 Tax=Rufibacter roseolus TaxID=2817375 RepID=UPI001B314F1C|nr:hypothetical protein [Rufibacter roseolus]